MTNRFLHIDTEHALGSLGLILLVIVAAMAERGYGAESTCTGRIRGYLARRVIDAVAVAGWLVDQLPYLGAPAPHPLPAGRH